MMDQIILETISSHMKYKVTANSRHEFTKGKSCVINLIVFCNGVTGAVDKSEGR